MSLPSSSIMVTVDDEVPSDTDKQLGNNFIVILMLHSLTGNHYFLLLNIVVGSVIATATASKDNIH